MSKKERDPYVSEMITKAMIGLLEDKEIGEISVSEICDTALVSRNSFYRNFISKEDILYKRIKEMMIDFEEGHKDTTSNAERYGDLFALLKRHEDFYLLLSKRKLLYLLTEVFMEISGPVPDDNNMWAYTKAFITKGTCGWIEEWINRGMQESAEAMSQMLSSYGMK